MSQYVKVEGLKELRRSLKQVSADLPKEVREVNRAVVTRIAVPAAKAEAARRTNPRAGSAVIDSIRGQASQTRAQLIGGNARTPQFKGMNYGSGQVRRTVRGGHTTQFAVRAPKDGRGNKGYILEAAVDKNLPRIVDAYSQMIESLMRSTGLK